MTVRKREFIPDGEDLYRRAYPNQYDKKTRRFSTGVFKLRRKEKLLKALSVDRSTHTTAEKACVDPYGKKFYLGALYAKVPRRHGLEVIYTPNVGNPAHSSIIGQKLIDSPLLIADILAEKCRPVITSI